MKTAVSVPDAVFARTEQLARRLKRSRSKIVSDALEEYLARHAPDEVTEAMDQALGSVEEPSGDFVVTAARRALRKTEW